MVLDVDKIEEKVNKIYLNQPQALLQEVTVINKETVEQMKKLQAEADANPFQEYEEVQSSFY